MSDNYIYKADVYCEACIKKIKADLGARGLRPKDPSNEYSYDSDNYPKGPFATDESDCPQHCADCGEPLLNDPTSDGVEYVAEALRKPRFYECGCCEHLHPSGWAGDCRDDNNRFTNEEVEKKYGGSGTEPGDGWVLIEFKEEEEDEAEHVAQ